LLDAAALGDEVLAVVEPQPDLTLRPRQLRRGQLPLAQRPPRATASASIASDLPA
jgi:hypothetical protein